MINHPKRDKLLPIIQLGKGMFLFSTKCTLAFMLLVTSHFRYIFCNQSSIPKPLVLMGKSVRQMNVSSMLIE